jgi:hypothetical protein
MRSNTHRSNIATVDARRQLISKPDNMSDARAGRRKNFSPPMTLANMCQNGVHAVIARCEACGHAADMNVAALAETITVPEVGRRLRCSGLALRDPNSS